MDLDIASDLEKSEEGSVLFLKDIHGNDARKGDGSPVWIKLAGSNSAKWRNAADQIGNKRLARANTKIGTSAKSMAEHREDQAFLFAAVTLEWEGIKVSGEVWQCNAENAKKLYILARYIYDQVEEFVNDQRNF